MNSPACCGNSQLCAAALLIARIFLGAGVLLWSGITMLVNWERVNQFLSTYGMHLNSPSLGLAILLMIAGGVLVLLGFYMRWVCTLLLCLSLPFLFFRLSFWGLEGYEAFVAERLFLALSAMMGGFILLMVTGPGRYALPSRESDWGAHVDFRNWGLLVGRILIGGCFFIWGAISRVTDWSNNLLILEINSIPMPGFVLTLMVILQIIGGIMIVFGWHQRAAAWVLIAYMAVLALTLFQFWDIQENVILLVGGGKFDRAFIEEIYAIDSYLQGKMFIDSLGVMAALLALTTCVSGKFGFDSRPVAS